ncbi:MAG: hypothetical protein ACYCPS_03385 [Candidatus Saccharimonadales bacterium]
MGIESQEWPDGDAFIASTPEGEILSKEVDAVFSRTGLLRTWYMLIHFGLPKPEQQARPILRVLEVPTALAVLAVGSFFGAEYLYQSIANGIHNIP